jgi:hypothetical protein
MNTVCPPETLPRPPPRRHRGGQLHAAATGRGQGAGCAGGESLGDGEMAGAVAACQRHGVGALHNRVKERVGAEQAEGQAVAGPDAKVSGLGAAPEVVAVVQGNGELAVGAEAARSTVLSVSIGPSCTSRRIGAGGQRLVGQNGKTQKHAFFEGLDREAHGPPSGLVSAGLLRRLRKVEGTEKALDETAHGLSVPGTIDRDGAVAAQAGSVKFLSRLSNESSV